MAIKRFVAFTIALLILVSSVNAALVVETITVDETYWTAPEGVTLINLKLIGAGGSGGAGGYAYQIGSNYTYFLKYAGAGGLMATPVTHSNIRVVPGTAYLIRVGMPGDPSSGSLRACPAEGGTTYQDIPGASYTGYNGDASYVTIDGTTYIGYGGETGNVTIQCNPGANPVYYSTNNYNPSGRTGYIVSSMLSQYGGTSLYGPGGSGGVGYGAGGGGGGMGGDYTSSTGGAGSGGVGSQGIVQISYDSTGTVSWHPSGYVFNASGTAIQNAIVDVTQGFNTESLLTDATGHYVTTSKDFISSISANITTSKTGYVSDYVNFIPLSQDTQVNITLLQYDTSARPPNIYGVTRHAWTKSTLPFSNVYLIENVTKSGYQTNVSTAGGYYQFDGITPGRVYDVWSSRSGSSNSSVYQVIG